MNTSNSSKSKTCSYVWNYFTICTDDSSKVQCNNGCKFLISRGKCPKEYSTSPLLTHLRSKHPDQYKEMEEQKKKESKMTSSASTGEAATSDLAGVPFQQQTLANAWKKNISWDINSLQARQVHRAIGEMIAIDMEPYQVVEKPGKSIVSNFINELFILS